jgi:hypothetical protein
MKLKNSVCLSDDRKAKMLRSVFNAPKSLVTIPEYRTRISSPFIFLFTRYALPIFALFFVGTYFGDAIVQKAELALGTYNTVKSDIATAQKSAELKNSLSLNYKDIVALKSAGEIDSSDKTKLIASVTDRSRDIRNQVASLVKENKITEAKQIVLTLETALKADELYKVATSVSATVFETTDLRLDIERKETQATTEATTSVKDLTDRIEADKKILADLEVNASTTSNITEATTFLSKSEEYVKAGNVENAIISLQAYDRIVAEVQLILLP